MLADEDHEGNGADLRRRAFVFASSVIGVHRSIYGREPSLRDLSRQAMRAATSIGANLEEADAAQSRADFVSKCNISLKEAREARYWLRLMANHVQNESIGTLTHEATELIAILTTIVRRSRRSQLSSQEK